ncbi:hypothetical protein Gotri_001236 [Gossypium trilobum]|uniref:Uncharacterized protein n=1 Tax=Gossypium trilobum TaxID=34281 RepID=A0A7J9FED5_9ROSI|nr:hypothetical protein [Gossypium trilobum]
MDYKKLRLSIRTAGLGKTSEHWRQEIKEEMSKANVMQGSLVESQNVKVALKTRVSELERSLHQYRSRNSVIELKASRSKIEELKGKIEELETVLQNCELRVRDRDYVMGATLTQVREVADHLQTLAVQALPQKTPKHNETHIHKGCSLKSGPNIRQVPRHRQASRQVQAPT